MKSGTRKWVGVSEDNLDTPLKKMSIVIPTYRREKVLLDTIGALLDQRPSAEEILVVDQSEEHDGETKEKLDEWHDQGDIEWIRTSPPSITAAMNVGLMKARNPVVLFLDDDILPGPRLIGAHAARYSDETITAVVGKVLQPGQESGSGIPRRRGEGIWRDLSFPFNSENGAEVFNCMAGNLSVRRDRALAAGGCDENFKGVAYRFETEFCRRLIRSEGKLVYEPSAWIRHLQAASGGTRAYGNPLTTMSPAHSMGDYYFALRDSRGSECLSYVAHRMFRSVRTRFHLTHPWWIPVKLTGEIRGLMQAYRLIKKAPAFVDVESK